MSGSQSTTGAYAPTKAADVVAVYDANFNQLFAKARPLTADVKPKARITKHPVETGAVISDFRIIDPKVISFTVVLDAADYINTYNEIEQFYEASNLANITTKTGTYQNYSMIEMPHKETAASFDTIQMTLSFEEVQFAQSSTSALPASMTSKNSGSKNAKAASTTQEGQATAKVQSSSALHSLIYGN